MENIIKLHKKAQETETIILIVAIVLIILIASLFTFMISAKTDKIKQEIEASGMDIQNKILLLNILAAKIVHENREVTVAEALNLVLYADKTQIPKATQAQENEQNQAFIKSQLNEILANFNSYGNENNAWKLSIYQLSNEKENEVLSISQAKDASHLDKTSVKAELELPSLYSTSGNAQDSRYIIKLISLED